MSDLMAVKSNQAVGAEPPAGETLGDRIAGIDADQFIIRVCQFRIKISVL